MSSQDSNKEKLLNAYHAVIDEVKELWHEAEEKALPQLKENLDKALEKASELKELTREETEQLGNYIEKDLNQAADFLSENSKQLKDWLQTDLAFAEYKFAEIFATLADKTRLELDELAERARQVGVWHTGEITHVGVLYCQSCGEALHFEKPGHVPPCPKCHHTEFKKVYKK